MIYKLYRCLKPESVHFYQLGNSVDMESEYYHYLQFVDGDIEILTKEEVDAINIIDTNTKQSWIKVTEEQYEFINNE